MKQFGAQFQCLFWKTVGKIRDFKTNLINETRSVKICKKGQCPQNMVMNIFIYRRLNGSKKRWGRGIVRNGRNGVN